MLDQGLDEILYPLADAVQCKLKYRGSTKRITGKGIMKIELMKGAVARFTLDAVSSFINKKEQQAGVLFHVRGHLYLLVAHNLKGKTLSAYIVSSKALGVRKLDLVDYLPKLCNIKTAVTELNKGVIKAYSRNIKRATWKELELPKSMRA